MEDLFGINARRQVVAENIEKAMTVGFTPDEELEKALGAGYDTNGEDGNIEKAHQVGDIHPNGKWVWTQLPSGKYDWRTIKKNTAEKKQEETGGSKEVDDFMDKVKTFNSKYTDTSKVSVIKTPKGNWDVSYDGHRLGGIMADQLSEKTAKKMGWLKEEKKEDKVKEKDLAEYAVGDAIRIKGIGTFMKVGRSEWVDYDPNTKRKGSKRYNYTEISDNGYAKNVTDIKN